jgi:hypothetical protein
VLWVLVDVLLVLASLAGLAMVVLGLWHKVTALGREVSRAGEAIGRATDELAQLQAAMPGATPEGPSTAAVAPVRTGRGNGRRRVG